YDQYMIQYNFIVAQSEDRVPPLALTNSRLLLSSLFSKYVQFATGEDSFPPSFNDENLFFYFQVDKANYNVATSTNQLDSNTVFRAGISNAYEGELYTFLDSYKIFDASLNAFPAVITNNNDIQRIKDNILEQIRWGLGR